MGPRANFACAPCAKAAGAAVVHEDLPVESKACPLTGKRRGFKRLYDGIQVSTTGHRVARVLDPMMKPQLEAQDRIRNETTASEQRLKDAHAESGLNQVMPKPYRWTSAGAALAGVDPGARAASREFLWPHINRTVRPLYGG